jgi:hypothetical protein
VVVGAGIFGKIELMIQELELPYLTSQTSRPPTIAFTPGNLSIVYDYDFKVLSPIVVTITFGNVLAIKYTDETCFAFPLEIISSNIVALDLESSSWLQQLRETRERTNRNGMLINLFSEKNSHRHFGISFGEWGIYEVVADSCVVSTDTDYMHTYR